MQTTLWAERRAMDSQSAAPGRRRRPPQTDAEPTPVCPICGGQGFVLLDVPMGHSDFGKAVKKLLVSQKFKDAIAKSEFKDFGKPTTW